MRRRDVVIGAGVAAAQSFSPASAQNVRNYKAVIVGDVRVGKTCALQTFGTNQFQSAYAPTIISAASTLPCTIDGREAVLNVWDVSGAEDAVALRPLTYPQTDVFILAYSIDSQDSISNVQSVWRPEIQHYAPGATMVLAGLKSDLRQPSGSNAISQAQAADLALQIQAAGNVECSARTRTGLTGLFTTTVQLAYGSSYPVVWRTAGAQAPRRRRRQL